MRGYAVAIRSALSDDRQAPLSAPGLRLHERLTQIQESLERIEKKGGDIAELKRLMMFENETGYSAAGYPLGAGLRTCSQELELAGGPPGG